MILHDECRTIERVVKPLPTVLRVDVRDVLSLRGRILRAGLPIEASVYPTDALPTTVHFGTQLGFDGTIVACGSFHQEPFEGEPAWRLRGMAVDATAQRGGLGRMLLATAERILPTINGVGLFWANARLTATGFYERLGWLSVGDVFETDGLPHVRMIKRVR